MKIRITQPVADAERIYQPGEIVDSDVLGNDKTAEWLANDCAVPFDETEPAPKRKPKAVNNDR